MGAWSVVPRALARSGAGFGTECMGAWSAVPRALARSGAGCGTECMGACSGVVQAPQPCSTWNGVLCMGVCSAAGQAPQPCSTWNGVLCMGVCRAAGQAPQRNGAGRAVPGSFFFEKNLRKYRKVPTFAGGSMLCVLRLIVKLSKKLYYGSTSEHVAARSEEKVRRDGPLYPGWPHLAA